MNTSAELRRFTDNQALEKAIKLVTEALIQEPLGLEISQIMNNCRLSNKTTKSVLNIINAENNDGVWSLRGQIATKTETVSPQPTAKKVEIMPAQTAQQPAVQVSYLKRLIEVFKKHPQGITLTNALEILGGKRPRFDSELSYLRKHHFPVRLENGLYIPELDQAPESKPKTATAKPLSQNVTVTEIKPQEPAIQPDVPLNQNVQDKVIEFRGMVQKRTIITEEVLLDADQLDNVLKDIFGLDTIAWSQVDGKVQVHLTKTKVA